MGRNNLKKSVELHPERNDCFKTDSDIEIKEVFTPLDIKDMDYLQDINFLGSILLLGAFSQQCIEVNIGP